jgi:F0F1-type ATP synthase epsilon subunit
MSTAQPTVHVRVASPFKVFYDDEAVSLSGSNATGPFDILPHHHKFISLLKEGDLAIRTPNGGTIQIRISGGIMHVKADLVTVFLNV